MSEKPDHQAGDARMDAAPEMVSVEREKFERMLRLSEELALLCASVSTSALISANDDSDTRLVTIDQATGIFNAHRTNIRRWAAEADALVPRGKGRWLVNVEMLRASQARKAAARLAAAKSARSS